MPSGLTTRIVDDETDTFEAFAWRCASQFFYDRGRAPDEVASDSFSRDRLHRDQYELKLILGVSDEMAFARARVEHELSIKVALESLTEARSVAARVGLFRCKLEAWDPPTNESLMDLKRIMSQQLDDLCEFEANVEMHEEHLAELEAKAIPTGPEWRNAKIVELEKSIQRSQKEVELDACHVADTNRWLSLLRESIPRPENEWGGKK